MKNPYYSIYCASIIEYLLNKHNEVNKDKLKTIFIDLSNTNDINKLKETLKKEDNCIISIFEPILINIDKFKNDFINFVEEFKEFKVKFELLSVYLTNKAFQEIKDIIEKPGIKMNFITIYFGDSLLSDENYLINGGKINPSSVDLGDNYVTRTNLINKFHFEKNKYLS